MTKQIIVLLLLFIWKCHCQQDHEHEHEGESGILESPKIWGFGFLAGLGVSLIGFVAAILVLTCKKVSSPQCFDIVIKVLFAFACGALLGDTIFHILPESYISDQVNGLYVSIAFVCAITFFLILQRFFQALGVSHTHWHDQSLKVQNRLPNQSNPNLQSSQAIQENQNSKGCCQNLTGKGSAGYLNLIGSLIHNFTDGLAIGIAFATGQTEEFIPVLIAIVSHEIPREMGDVAILLSNKFTDIQTILCNGVVNMISIVGTLIGLSLQHFSEGTKIYLLVFVAGNFIYIAADIWRHLFRSQKAVNNLLQFIGFIAGASCMLGLTFLETEEHSH